MRQLTLPDGRASDTKNNDSTLSQTIHLNGQNRPPGLGGRTVFQRLRRARERAGERFCDPDGPDCATATGLETGIIRGGRSSLFNHWQPCYVRGKGASSYPGLLEFALVC